MTITNSFQFRVGDMKNEVIDFLQKLDWEYVNILATGECEKELPREEWGSFLVDAPKIQRHMADYDPSKPFVITISSV